MDSHLPGRTPNIHAPANVGAVVLRLAERLGALRYGHFRLSAGGTSPYYFDARILSLDPAGAYLIGSACLATIRSYRPALVAGPATGAVPVVTATTLLSHLDGEPSIPGTTVMPAGGYLRADPARALGHSFQAGSRVAVVDDVCSSGHSILAVTDAIEAARGSVAVVFAVLDRHEGGSAAIGAKGYPFHALLEVTSGNTIIPSAPRG